LLSKVDPATGRPKKISFGAWMMSAFRLLARFRFLRGTPLDPFGYSAERRVERALVRDYGVLLAELIADLTPQNHALAVAIASIPEKIRGFGPVKERHLIAAKAEEAELLERFRAKPAEGEIGLSAAAAE
jgi:indolepyruvate ferredoxin oxidoreductase